MSKAENIGDILVAYFRENGLEQQILGDQIIEKWPQVMGLQVARLTGKMEIQNQVLHVQIRSAALRQQLFECRAVLIRKLNDSVGAQVIKDIRLR